MPAYMDMDELLLRIDEPIRSGLLRIVEDHGAMLRRAPGSRRSHQAWMGGYWDHVTDVMNLAVVLYHTMGNLRPLEFSLSDALVVLFLHDIEKPWKYEDAAMRQALESKAARKDFRLKLAAEYGLGLSDSHLNGLEYVEGENEKYVAGERVMGPLAAFCHMCDIASGRIWFDRPRLNDESWGSRSSSRDAR